MFWECNIRRAETLDWNIVYSEDKPIKTVWFSVAGLYWAVHVGRERERERHVCWEEDSVMGGREE